MRRWLTCALGCAACTSHAPAPGQVQVEEAPAASPQPSAAAPEAAAPQLAPPSSDAAAPEDAVVDPAPAGEPGEELTALQTLLGGGVPEAVEIEVTHPVGRERLVLYRYMGARAWRGRQPPETLAEELARLEEAVEPCREEAQYDDPGDVDCALKIAGERHLAWMLLGREVFAWELARTRPGPGGPQEVARRRLIDGVTSAPDDDPTKLKVYDVDGDGRSEATVIVSVRPPAEHALEQTRGQVGFVVDASDLHVQFEATRRYENTFSDVSTSSTEAETVWLARDVDGDGHADLQVRETVRNSYGDDEDGPSRPQRENTSKKIVCPYDQAADVWRCPEALGRQLLGPGSG